MKNKYILIIGTTLVLNMGIEANADWPPYGSSNKQSCSGILSIKIPRSIIQVKEGRWSVTEAEQIADWQDDRRYKEESLVRRMERAEAELAEALDSKARLEQKSLNQNILDETLFIIPANDGEAVASIAMLSSIKAPFLQISSQGWGASLDKERIREAVLNKIKRVVVFEMPSEEIEAYLKEIGLEVLVMDHHDYPSLGLNRQKDESSFEQLADLIGYELSPSEKALSVNDQDYIQGMKKLGLTNEQIRAVRKYDLIAQGKRYESIVKAEEEAQNFLIKAEKLNGVHILKQPKGLTPYLYTELGLRTKDGRFNALEISFPGKIGFSGDKDFVKKLMAIDFESFGFEKGSYAHYAAGGGSLMGFKLTRGVSDVETKMAGLIKHVEKLIEAHDFVPEILLAPEVSTDQILAEIKTLSKEYGAPELKLEDINYKVFGDENAEPLVLIHGLNSAYQTFENLISSLSKDYRLILIDQRGHGQSADSTDFSSESMARDLKMVLDHLGVEKANILGHSMGARTATRFASMFPDRVSSLIIEDMELLIRTSLKDPKAMFEKAMKMREAFEGKIFADRDALIAALKPYYGDESESVSYRRAIENEDKTMTLLFRPWNSVLYGTQGNLEDFSAELKGLKMPVLVMQADPKKGTALPDEGVEHILSLVPQAILDTFEGIGHTIHRPGKDLFLKSLVEFLTENKAGAELETKDKSILDEGTKASDSVKAKNMLPRGSALLTSSGKLADAGITAIVHAASGAMGASGGEFEPTLDSIYKSTSNSVKLAVEHGHKRVAVPFIGGKIFAERIGTSPENIAAEIVKAALKYKDQIEIRFVTFGDVDTNIFREQVQKLSENPDDFVLSGSLTDFDLHGASAIVNAANMEVRFGGGTSKNNMTGGGLSGIIARAAGLEEARGIDEEAARTISEYYK